MSKTFWKGSVLLAPVPPALISCGSIENPNVMTAAWTGIVNTHPPVTYVSIRPSRYSHEIISKTGEFVINLPTAALCRTVDFCGVKSGRDTDKFEVCGLHTAAAEKIFAPIIEECPVALECRVREVKNLGTHDMFLADIVGVDIDDKYLDSKGKFNLQQCGLLAYAHGEYFSLGKKLGDFGFSVRKKKKRRHSKKD